MHISNWAIVFCCLASPLFSQNQISGIINEYAKVVDIEPCEAKLSLENNVAFSAGNTVLLLQMKGAVINNSNSSSFGTISDIGSAGLYELNEVLSVSGNMVFLKYALVNDYQPASALQLVKVPQYTNVEVSGELNAKPWDGQTGGVLAIIANQLDLQANINVSGAGFRGGQKLEVVSDCNFLTNADAYFYPINNWRGSPKGEGIAEPTPAKEHGRGAQANGGGGGNDHNSGGGGGANVSGGGVGGNESVGGFGCDGNYPGLGGKPFPDLPERILMGGGGGAGHFDDNNAGSSGGNGGGIALILADNIFGNGFSIAANGNNAPLAHGDGAGGGGAGGTVLIKSNSIQGELTIGAKGGNGGNVNNSSDRCDGTGGGGSGGRLLSNSMNFNQVNLQGGQPGVNNTISSQCNGQSNGATEGEPGIQSTLTSIPSSQTPIAPVVILQQPEGLSICEGEPAIFTFQVDGNSLSYQWQMNTGNGWVNIPSTPAFAGALTQQFSIANSASTLDGTQFRCVVMGACGSDFYSEVVLLEVGSAPSAGFSTVILGTGIIQFQNSSGNASSYLWDFGDGTTSTEQNPVHNFSSFGSFTVMLTSISECGEDEFLLNVLVENPDAQPVAHFSSDVTSGCSPLTVHFQSLSTGNGLTSFEWQFPGGNPSFSNQENPTVSYASPGLYQVSLTVASTLGSNSILVEGYLNVKPAPNSNFSFNEVGQTVYFTNQSSGSTSYNWDFGDGNESQATNPIHEYVGTGVFDVVLTANNGLCASSIAQEIYLAPSIAEGVGQGRSIIVYPNPVKKDVQVVLPSENWREFSSYKVSDIAGRPIITANISAKSLVISMTDFNQGMYFLEISDGNKVLVWKLAKL